MKAFVCPQCGGLLDKVTGKQTIVECGYCSAKIFVQEAEKPADQPEKRDTLHIPLSDYKPFDETDPTPYESEPYTGQDAAASTSGTLIGIFGGLIIIVTMLALVFVAAKKSGRGNPTPSPTPYVYVRETPAPPRSVRSCTNEDAVSLPQPVIPSNMFFKTEFDVEAYVSIDEKGNVFEASTNTDIAQIKRIVIAAAMKAKFPPSPTSQKTSGVISYVLGPSKTK